GRSPAFVTVDLGAVKPISGFSFNTAAGVAGVRWPASVMVFVSDDGKQWYEVCDLVREASPGFLPEYGTYAVRKLSTTSVKTHGRYVQFVLLAGGPYAFVDEVEVYAGPPGYLSQALSGEPVSDVPTAMKSLRVYHRAQGQMRRDLDAIRSYLEACKLPEERRQQFLAEAQKLETAIASMPRLPEQGFRAVLPFNDVHRQILGLQARIWRAEKKPTLRVWHCHRWDYLAPTAEPSEGSGAPALEVRMMRGEVRADVVNFTSAAEADLELRLRLTGLPGGANPPYVRVFEVPHVGTTAYRSIAAALVPARRDGGDYVVKVPRGMAAQVWLEFRPDDLRPGRYEGTLVAAAEGLAPVRVPVRLTVSPLRFPERTSLLLGGWSYTDRTSGWGVTKANRDAFILYLKDHCVNAPWATGSTMPEGTYDDQNRLVEAPDTRRFDEWAKSWAGSRMYMVFLARGDSFAGAKMGTPAFDARLGEWAHFWARHLQEIGIKPSQLGLLIYDEPRDERGYNITVAWARAIHAAEPEFKTFVDPIPASPKGLEKVLQAVDMLCPNRVHWLTRDWLAPLYSRYRQQGKQLCFYSCSGPARSFDPFAYYLLQEWHCFKVGATGSFFWSFGDIRSADVWNEYATEGPGPYAPLFLAADEVISAKGMEAIREGVEDYEYLVMLQKRLGELKGTHKVPQRVLRRAAEVLEKGVDEVLAAAPEAEFTWHMQRDRRVADRVRSRVLDALEALSRY
ncbi:MAG: discoidin domain-containing protein, partial [Armatimonadetes bacterium]|nr:discoidin domain-containing protein [Armatimonadota bacterium]